MDQRKAQWSGLVLSAAMVTAIAAGCTTQDAARSRPAGYGGIPREAIRVAEGSERLDFTPGGEGRIWVGDEAQRRLMLSRVIDPSDQVVVDPQAGVVTISGEPAGDIDTDGRRALFFEAASGGTALPQPYGTVAPVALAVESGAGRLAFTTPVAGRVWVGNDHDKTAVYSRHVYPGDTILIDPAPGTVTLNGNTVTRLERPREDASPVSHTIFLKPAASGPAVPREPPAAAPAVD